ncbi:MAG: PAS domain S-box protein, partial [Desulfobacterales bacterium]|nr:PAS domain S-box protein [Desulfobacterales bacterium]
EKDSLTYWRVRILFAIVVTALMIGLIAFLPAIALSIKEKLWSLLFFDAIAWPVGFSLLISRRLKYEIRAAIVLVSFYVLGLVIIISVGLLSGGPIWLVAFAVLVGVLLGFKAAITALLVNVITLSIISWLISAGKFGQTFPFFSSMEAMLAAGGSFMILNTIAAVSVAVLVKGLISTHQKEDALYQTLKTERLHLIKAKKDLEHEVEERLHTEEVLRESERLYRLLADNVNDNIWTMDMAMKFTYVSPSINRLRGYTVEEAMAQSFEEVVTPASLDIALKAITEELEQHNQGEKPQDRSRKVELELKCKDGSTVWTETEANFLYDADGQPQSIIGVTRDITERKRAEKALRESEEKHRLLAENTVDCIWQMNLEQEFTYINEAVFPFLGYTPKEFIGSNLSEHCSSEEMKKMEAQILNVLANLPDKTIAEFETSFYHKNGEEIPCEIIGKIIQDDTGNPIYIQGTTRNITDRKRAEEALRESEEKLVRSKKMESLGLLAGGVAHDLNNVLSGIVSYPELILMDLPEDSKLRNPIETIQESGNRAAEIVQDLLTVARGVATTKGPLNLNDLVEDYLHSPEFNKLKQFHPTATVKTTLDKDLFNISGSHVHIRKIVMNLVSNAAEAIEGSGNVIITTVNRYLDRPLRGYDDVNIGEYAILSVSDDGSGISSDDLERIFEPFYTKKMMGRSGTGLGLAVVWNTVQDHKGYIDVISLETGTTFELYFPITRDEVTGKDLSRSMKDYQGNQEMILVVDDMENQREISCKMLDKLGYKTKSVSSGEEAVDYLQENTVDLILLDMIMDPGINGRDTYERIIKIHRKQKAIIVSGFAQTDEV